VVIRVNPDPDESLIGRIFLHDRLVVVASPTLTRGGDAAIVPAVVSGSRIQASVWEVSGASPISFEPVMRLSSLFMVRDAVRLGVGVARLPLSLVSQDLASGKLVSWGDVEGTEVALWALYPSRRLLSPRVSAFLNYLKAAFPMGTPDELAAYMVD
jgi:DNA-binding transcriptional LysR family regulator